MPVRMRVLVAARRGSSGIRTYTDVLASSLARHGHEVLLVDEEAQLTGQHDLVKVIGVGPPNGISARFAPVRGWSRRSLIGELADQHGVDIVHVTHLDLAPRNLPTVVTAWDPLVGAGKRFFAARKRGERPLPEAAYAITDAVAIHRSRGVIAVTADVATGARRFGRPVVHVPPFLADDTVRPPRDRSAALVLVANSIDGPRKGLDLAVAAVELVRRTRPDVTLDLIGRWIEPARQLDLPAYCRALGPLPRTEVQDRLGTYGCAVVASLWEEFGYAGLEALAAGTPIATAPLPGYLNLSGGGVFRAHTRTAGALAESILRALDIGAFQFPQECRASNAVPKIVDLYRLVVDAGSTDTVVRSWRHR